MSDALVVGPAIASSGVGIDDARQVLADRLLPADRWRRLLHSSGLLIAAGLLAVAPMLGIGILAVAEANRAHEAEAEARLADTARVIAANLDGVLQSRVLRSRFLSVLPAFDQFPTMAAAHWDQLVERLRDFGEAFPESHMVVWQVDGAIPIRITGTHGMRQRLAAPATTPTVIEAIARAVRTREPAVSDVFSSPVTGQHGVLVAAPVLRGNRVMAVISATVRISEVQSLLDRQSLPEGASVGISADGETVLARRPQRFIGDSLPEDLRQAIRSSPAGVMRVHSLDGVPVVAAFTRMAPPSHFAVKVWAPVAALEAPWHQSRALLLAGGLVASAIAVGAMLVWAAAWRAAQETAQQREAHLHTALEASGLSSWEARLDNGDTAWSPSCGAIFGWGEAGPPTASLAAWWRLLHPADSEAVRAAWQAFREAPGATFETTYRIARYDDGEIRWCRMLARHSGDGRAIGVVFDVTEARRNEARVLLAREVDHRANNLLAVVQAMVAMTRAEDGEALRATLGERIRSLAKTHSLLSRRQSTGLALDELVAHELGTYGDAVRPDGATVMLRPEAVQPLGMALHELATNAAKYGGLSAPDGRVALRWEVTDGMLRVRWQEEGGPPAAMPTRSGFGTRMIGEVIGQLGGKVGFGWERQGISVGFAIPAERVIAAAPAQEPPAAMVGRAAA